MRELDSAIQRVVYHIQKVHSLSVESISSHFVVGHDDKVGFSVLRLWPLSSFGFL